MDRQLTRISVILIMIVVFGMSAVGQQSADEWHRKALDLYNTQDRYEETIQACNKALELNPHDANCWGYKGISLMELGRVRDGLIALARAQELGVTYNVNVSFPYFSGWSNPRYYGEYKLSDLLFDEGANRAKYMDLIGVPDVSPRELDARYDDKVDPNNPLVHDKALAIASRYPGSYNIDQVGAIFEYVNSGWTYVNDPNSRDYINSADESIKLGESSGSSGVGDCEDFAVLMASMIESIGGSARIIHTEGNDGSHAYAEVYIGNGSESDLGNNQFDLTAKYYQPADLDNPIKFFIHQDGYRNAHWLNLDGSANHPGGPFMKGDKSWILWESDHPLIAPYAQPQSDSVLDLDRLRTG
jgi:tetratricopeptide (TPR) repeat protein